MVQQLALPQDELERKAGALRIISLGLAAAVVGGETAALIIWLADRSFPVMTVTVLAVVMFLVSLSAYWLSRSGWVKLAGYLFVIAFLVETAAITLLLGGATGPLAIIYIFPILVSGIVIGVNYSFLAATLAVILYLGMIPVEQAGIIVPVFGSGARGSVIPFFITIWVIFFYLVAFLSWFAANRLNRALQDVRRFAADLQGANEKLQASEEELRASNEELRASEEELRASNEELETANEELKEAQERLIRSEKLAAIGQLAGGVGHELRNPLGAIKNAVYYIRGKLTDSELVRKEPRVAEFLDIVDDEINSSNKIISDLLSFSRVGKPAVSPVRIEKVIDDAIAHTPIPEGIELIKKPDAGLPEVEMDSDQMRQVLINMITNAVQAMPEGGRLTIVAMASDGFLDLKITDTGVGIPGEAMNKLFNPLFTTKAKGIGLGLAVCKSIVERHGGHIDVASTAGRGTTFTVKLPLKAG